MTAVDLRDPNLRRLEVVFLVATTTSMVVSLVLGVETWRAVIYIGASVLGWALPIQMRRGTGRFSLKALLFLVSSGLFTTAVCTGGLEAPWLVLVVMLTAGAAGTLEGRDARVVLILAFCMLAISILIEVVPIPFLDVLPPAYDRGVEGPGRWHANLNFLVSCFAALIPGGAVARLTVRETARAIDQETQAKAQTVASVQARSELVTGMTAALSMELAQPIARTRRRLEALLSKSSGVDAERLQVLARETERLAQLVGQATGIMKLADVATVVRDVVAGQAALAAEKQVTVTFGGETLVVPTDEMTLRQVLVNLILNAIEASPVGGEVGVVVVGTRILVEDRGHGLRSDARVFESGYTTKPGGSGVGLVVARVLAGRMQARLLLENRDGGGCRATLDFATAQDIR